jgi:hypothetical protein
LIRNNKNNDGHILTPTERLFYQRMSMEGVKQIIDECWKIIKNPEVHECKAMEAMQIALEANVQLCNMLKSMKQQYGSVEEALKKSVHDYDYGR